MRIVTLEEHIAFPEMTKLIPTEILGNFGQSPVMQKILPKLADVTNERLASMDENGISMQVLSVDSFGANLLSAKTAPAFGFQFFAKDGFLFFFCSQHKALVYCYVINVIKSLI